MRFLSRPIYYGWYVLAAVSGINFANNATAIGVLTVFIVPLTTEFAWSRTQISAVTSIGAVLGALTSPLTGRLTDRLGARVPLTLGVIFIVLATLGLASMRSLPGFYLSFGLARLADQAFVQTPSPPAIAKWFQRHRGRAMAVLFFSSSAGGVALPILVQVIIMTWGWRLAWVILGATVLVLGLLPCALLVKREPGELGVSVDGAIAPETVAQHPSRAEDAVHGTVYGGDESWQLGEALKTPTLWLLLICIFVGGVAWTGVGLHLVPYLLQQGVAPQAAVAAVSLTFLVSSLGTLLWGFIADRLSVRHLLAITYALRAVSIAVLLRADTLSKAYMFAIVQGFSDAGLGVLPTVLLANYYGRQHLGSIYGLLRAVQVAGFALGPLVSGITFDVTRNYHTAFAAFLALSVLGTVLVPLARQPKPYHRVR